MAGREHAGDGGRGRHADQFDRDLALEGRYVRWCGEGCCGSLLASVSAHRDQMVLAYMEWVKLGQDRRPLDQENLRAWETDRFGATFHAAAHALLLFAVREAIFGPAQPRRHEPKPTPGLSDEARRQLMLVELHKLAARKQMPEKQGRLPVTRRSR
jgi:hypothetical protein